MPENKDKCPSHVPIDQSDILKFSLHYNKTEKNCTLNIGQVINALKH